MSEAGPQTAQREAPTERPREQREQQRPKREQEQQQLKRPPRPRCSSRQTSSCCARWRSARPGARRAGRRPGEGEGAGGSRPSSSLVSASSSDQSENRRGGARRPRGLLRSWLRDKTSRRSSGRACGSFRPLLKARWRRDSRPLKKRKELDWSSDDENELRRALTTEERKNQAGSILCLQSFSLCVSLSLCSIAIRGYRRRRVITLNAAAVEREERCKRVRFSFRLLFHQSLKRDRPKKKKLNLDLDVLLLLLLLPPAPALAPPPPPAGSRTQK